MRALIVATLLLAGCAGTPVVKIQREEVPVVQKCGVKPDAPQVHTDAELSKATDRRLILGLAEDRSALLSYQAKVDAGLSACWQ